ncbi:sigma factor-like helix-turn-helix DNA-binding protein [Dactylosporangium sucinum]|uniref:DNA-directed RNA polymerase sigma-70 factor n=1 Tax=Dactylosporangium sucinum TaxID=1424081 RepID=A0A917WN98_9ACTN|nr:sigma factor-like helix-turn-helix DNA-binding protein [Dactylosporangium sucinum]GGM16007.1 DNA-directed RNA polymerase sigma-70 factor [Dactylosporangium sucinum]
MRVRTVGAPTITGITDFEAFYRAEADRLYRALAVTLGDPHLAREAADEAMARTYARWSQVRDHENPGGWAFRVGLNWATSWWRKVRRERPLPPPDLADPAAQESGDRHALTALHRLPLPQRTVIVCRVLLDLSTVETAAVLGIAEGTVKSRMARGLAELRRVLGEER